MTQRDAVSAVLRFDALAIAEKLTGKSYKADEGTSALGMLLHIEHARSKSALLEAAGDSTFSDSVERYQGILDALGFECVYEAPFAPEPGRDERHFIYAHRDGLLLTLDTFTFANRAPGVNAAKVYFNWRPNGEVHFPRDGASGGFCQNVEPLTFAGDYDAREALVFKLGNLRADGQILARWVEQPFIWLLHHGDTRDKDYDYRAINEARSAMLPDWVREMVTPAVGAQQEPGQ